MGFDGKHSAYLRQECFRIIQRDRIISYSEENCQQARDTC